MNRIASFVHCLNDGEKSEMNRNCIMALMLSFTVLLTSCNTVSEQSPINHLPSDICNGI